MPRVRSLEISACRQCCSLHARPAVLLWHGFRWYCARMHAAMSGAEHSRTGLQRQAGAHSALYGVCASTLWPGYHRWHRLRRGSVSPRAACMHACACANAPERSLPASAQSGPPVLRRLCNDRSPRAVYGRILASGGIPTANVRHVETRMHRRHSYSSCDARLLPRDRARPQERCGAGVTVGPGCR